MKRIDLYDIEKIEENKFSIDYFIENLFSSIFSISYKSILFIIHLLIISIGDFFDFFPFFI